MKNLKQFLSYLLRILLLNKYIIEPSNEELESSSRILGGRISYVGWFPYMVSVQLRYPSGNLSQCGGSILSDTWILSAAHCVDDNVNYVYVIAGSVDNWNLDRSAQTKFADRIFQHPSWKKNTVHLKQFDIALIQLESPLQFNQFVLPIDLPKQDSIPTGWGIIMGWGRTNPITKAFSENLLYAYVPLIPLAECQNFYGAHVTNNQICVGTNQQISCNGDSGGPFIQYTDGNVYIVGIASFGVNGCNLAPTVFVRVSAFVTNFILPTINTN